MLLLVVQNASVDPISFPSFPTFICCYSFCPLLRHPFMHSSFWNCRWSSFILQGLLFSPLIVYCILPSIHCAFSHFNLFVTPVYILHCSPSSFHFLTLLSDFFLFVIHNFYAFVLAVTGLTGCSSILFLWTQYPRKTFWNSFKCGTNIHLELKIN